MKTYITSDLHFGHKRIKLFCPGPRARFSNDIDEMNEQMIIEWNDIVNIEDTVYILGDVAFLPSEQSVNILNRLNGTKILIEGNHDRKSLKDLNFCNCFLEIHKYYEMCYDDTFVVMLHYPIAEFNQMHRGAVHFHGHLHGSSSGLEHYRVRDIGMDATGQIVTLMEDAIKISLTGQIKGHH